MCHTYITDDIINVILSNWYYYRAEMFICQPDILDAIPLYRLAVIPLELVSDGELRSPKEMTCAILTFEEPGNE